MFKTLSFLLCVSVPLWLNPLQAAEPLANKANVLLLTVAGFKDSEKVTTTEEFSPTSADPSFGVTLMTVGGSVSATAAVWKERLR